MLAKTSRLAEFQPHTHTHTCPTSRVTVANFDQGCHKFWVLGPQRQLAKVLLLSLWSKQWAKLLVGVSRNGIVLQRHVNHLRGRKGWSSTPD